MSGTRDITPLQLVCPCYLANRSQQEWVLYLGISSVKYVRLLGTEGTGEQRASVRHAIRPPGLHSSSSANTGIQGARGRLWAELGTGGYASNRKQDKFCCDPLSTTASRVMLRDAKIISPSPSSIAQGNALLTVSACNFLPCHLHGRQFQGQDKAPDAPSGFHWVSVTRSRGLNKIVVERL